MVRENIKMFKEIQFPGVQCKDDRQGFLLPLLSLSLSLLYVFDVQYTIRTDFTQSYPVQTPEIPHCKIGFGLCFNQLKPKAVLAESTQSDANCLNAHAQFKTKCACV